MLNGSSETKEIRGLCVLAYGSGIVKMLHTMQTSSAPNSHPDTLSNPKPRICRFHVSIVVYCVGLELKLN